MSQKSWVQYLNFLKDKSQLPGYAFTKQTLEIDVSILERKKKVIPFVDDNKKSKRS
jgi:hypothetical protein